MFKKLILTVAAFIAFQGLASALTWVDINATALTNQAFYFKSSNAVGVIYANDALGVPQAYDIAAKHTAGDRLYSTSSHSSNIMYKDYSVTNAATMGKGIVLNAAAASTFTDLPTVAGESVYTGWIAQ